MRVVLWGVHHISKSQLTRWTKSSCVVAIGQVVSSPKRMPEFCWDPCTCVYVVVVVKLCRIGRNNQQEYFLDLMTCPDDSFSLSLPLWLGRLVIVNSSCVFADSSQVFDIQVVNISATNMTLTWKINDNESSSVYMYEIQVATETSVLNVTVNETRALISQLSPSTLYNITVRPFLGNCSKGMPGFLQVYTREFTRSFASLSSLLAMHQAQVQDRALFLPSREAQLSVWAPRDSYLLQAV